jgi:hypothetical protein
VLRSLQPQAASVVAPLSYVDPTSERPVEYAYPPPNGEPWESCRYEPRAVRIADARALVPGASVHAEGFELRDAPTAVTDFLDKDEVTGVYYGEAAELALAVTGARHAHVFDHLVRKREAGRPALGFGRRGGGRPSANGRIHNDYTEESGRRRLALVLTDPRAASGVGRYAIVNIWRSIRGPVLDTPLAVCDARSVSAADLVVSEVRYADRSGEIYLLRHSRRHRWFYFPAMDRHEALVFKQYDSQVSGGARYTPHAAFDHPDTPADAPLRESIEVRCLVVYD